MPHLLKMAELERGSYAREESIGVSLVQYEFIVKMYLDVPWLFVQHRGGKTRWWELVLMASRPLVKADEDI